VDARVRAPPAVSAAKSFILKLFFLCRDAARESFSLKVEARAAEMEEEDDNEQQGFVYGMVSEAFPGSRIVYKH
jgi:hypothetical protein